MFDYMKLLRIQMSLKVPKAQYNTYGGYSYRSCEDILCAAKPILEKEKCTLFFFDELVFEGERYYVRACAVLVDCETGEEIRVKSYAREPSTRKSMDESQITGTCSSYARKYALNGLFLLDDTKDADTDEFQKEQENKKAKKKSRREEKLIKLKDKCTRNHIDLDKWACQYDPPKKISELTEQDIDSMLDWIRDNFGDE